MIDGDDVVCCAALGFSAVQQRSNRGNVGSVMRSASRVEIESVMGKI
jgi:hypothetical protein